MSLSSQIGASRSDELRSFRKSDLDDYAAMNADPEVLRYLGCEAEPWDRSGLLGTWPSPRAQHQIGASRPDAE